MLGTVAGAEDAVQDAWLRWSAAPRPVIGAARVARFLAAISAQPCMGVDRSEMTAGVAEINGTRGSWSPSAEGRSRR